MTKVKNDQGFVLITAVSVLMIMLLLGLAVMATVDTQVTETGHEKAGEAAFNLAEGVLQAEAYQLQVAWPSTRASALPACNQSSPQTVGCEGVALTNNLSSTYSGPNYAGATWSAQVIDDPTGTSYYSDSLASTLPSWDQFNTGHMWVRAQAVVGGQKRILVEQMVRQDSVLTLPDNTVTAGGVYSENLGNKVMIEARDGYSGLTGPVEVRCGSAQPPTQPSQGQGNCLGWSADKGQLSPASAYGAGYVDPNGGYQTLSDAQIQNLIQTAVANNTYYPTGTCPPAGKAGIVVVQNANCSYQGQDTWNSSAAPGALIFLNGTLHLSGTEKFYGVIYMANQSGQVPMSGPCTSAQMNTVVAVDGNASVYGAVFADHCGVVAVGESGSPNGASTNINFSANGLNGLYAAQAARPAQSTFRIIPNP
jgi:Tfp pilus assembly protein PilX